MAGFATHGHWPVGSASLGHYFTMQRDRSAIASLDGLRAFAILLVFFRHAAAPFYQNDTVLLPLFGWDLAVPMTNGWIGVDLFFVLSGFLIGQSLLRQRASGGRIRVRNYVAKRALRIVPAYFAVLFLVAGGLFPLFEVDPRALGLRLAYHMVFLQDYLPANLLVVFWSLGVEEKFYLAAPVVVALALATPRRSLQYMVIVGFALLGPVGRAVTALAQPEITSYDAFFPVFRSPFHLCLDPLFLGLLGSLIYRDRDRWAWAAKPPCQHLLFLCGIALIAGLVAFEPMMERIDLFDKTLQPFAIALGMMLILLAAALGGGPRRLLESRLLLYLSKLSYSLYLVHLAFLPLSLAVVVQLGVGEPATGGVSWLLFVAVYAGISLTAALVLHFVVEKPFLILKARLD